MAASGEEPGGNGGTSGVQAGVGTGGRSYAALLTAIFHPSGIRMCCKLSWKRILEDLLMLVQKIVPES